MQFAIKYSIHTEDKVASSASAADVVDWCEQDNVSHQVLVLGAIFAFRMVASCSVYVQCTPFRRHKS